MGSASSSELQAAIQNLKDELGVLAGIARSIDEENLAKPLEALSKSPDLSTDDVALSVLECLVRSSSSRAPKRKASGELNPKAPKRKASEGVNAREKALRDHFERFRFSRSQTDRLISLAGQWESQRAAIVEVVARDAPRWKQEPGLFWGKYTKSAVPSTTIAKVEHLFYKIEELDTIGPARRRIYLVIIHEIIENEVDLLSRKINELRDVDKQYAATTKQLQKCSTQTQPRQDCGNENPRRENLVRRLQDSQQRLARDQASLRNRIEQYPQSPCVRKRVIQKLADDLWDTAEIPEGEKRKNKDKLGEYARWGKKYSQLRPPGAVLLWGDIPPTVYEREHWSDDFHGAMESYWRSLSGVYDTCLSYSPLIETLKQGYWELVPTTLGTKGADLSDLPSGSSPLGSAQLGGQHNHTEMPHTPSLSAAQTRYSHRASENFAIPHDSQPDPSSARRVGGTVDMNSLPGEYMEKPASGSLAPPSSAENLQPPANTGELVGGHGGGPYAPLENELSRTDMDSFIEATTPFTGDDQLPSFAIDLDSFIRSQPLFATDMDSFIESIEAEGGGSLVEGQYFIEQPQHAH
ncbi:MAG: hypothetical protein M1840_002152 [Geoglossum simile]|nr:MAG: hypothetical protein M1840_002152 [Geoglossum simile]